MGVAPGRAFWAAPSPSLHRSLPETQAPWFSTRPGPSDPVLPLASPPACFSRGYHDADALQRALGRKQACGIGCWVGSVGHAEEDRMETLSGFLGVRELGPAQWLAPRDRQRERRASGHETWHPFLNPTFNTTSGVRWTGRAWANERGARSTLMPPRGVTPGAGASAKRVQAPSHCGSPLPGCSGGVPGSRSRHPPLCSLPRALVPRASPGRAAPQAGGVSWGRQDARD